MSYLSGDAAAPVILIWDCLSQAGLWISEPQKHKAKADKPPPVGEKPGSATAKAACGKRARQTRNILTQRHQDQI